MIDFNIHPAKKEVRFRNLADVHSGVVSAVRQTLSSEIRQGPSTERSGAGQAPRGFESFTAVPGSSATRKAYPLPSRGAVETNDAGNRVATQDAAHRAAAKPGGDAAQIRFLGQVFGVFLVFELPERLLILDQHAAHERIIFERLGAGGLVLQEMLFPLVLDASEEEALRIDEARADLLPLGIEIRRSGPRVFEVTALAHDLLPLPEETLVELIRGVGGEEWRNSLRAAAACRLAIKEGDVVDPITARELCAQALELPVPRCPHGRPIWHELPEETLRRLVDRPVR